MSETHRVRPRQDAHPVHRRARVEGRHAMREARHSSVNLPRVPRPPEHRRSLNDHDRLASVAPSTSSAKENQTATPRARVAAKLFRTLREHRTIRPKGCIYTCFSQRCATKEWVANSLCPSLVRRVGVDAALSEGSAHLLIGLLGHYSAAADSRRTSLRNVATTMSRCSSVTSGSAVAPVSGEQTTGAFPQPLSASSLLASSRSDIFAPSSCSTCSQNRMTGSPSPPSSSRVLRARPPARPPGFPLTPG